MSNYKTLDAWKISMELVKDIYKLTSKYPKEELLGLTSQIKRASVSIPANIAEGIGRQYKKDTIQFLHISRGSLHELETLLLISESVGIITQETMQNSVLLIEKTMQILNGLINYYQKAENLK
jgi:four helix bundle protein